MKVIDTAVLPKVEPLCPKCDVPMEFIENLHDEIDEFCLDDRFEYAWFECRKCREKFIVEDYTNKGKREKKKGLFG